MRINRWVCFHHIAPPIPYNILNILRMIKSGEIHHEKTYLNIYTTYVIKDRVNG